MTKGSTIMIDGIITINGITTVEYEIENTLEYMMGDPVYKARVRGRDIDGYPYKYEFVLTHQGGGVETLVWGVLQKTANMNRLAKIERGKR